MSCDFGLQPPVGAIELARRSELGVFGTAEYMSPEQVMGETDIDGRSDVYNLACMVYEMIWGQSAVLGSASLVLRRQLSAEPMPLSCRLLGVPHAVSAAVARALAKEPAHRFATAGEFAEALRDGCDFIEASRPSGDDRGTSNRAAGLHDIPRAAVSVVVATRSRIGLTPRPSVINLFGLTAGRCVSMPLGSVSPIRQCPSGENV